MPTPRLSAYPWDRLETVPRRVVRAAKAARRRFEHAVPAEALSRALGSVLGSDALVVVRSVAAATEAPEPSRSIHLETADGAGQVVLEPAADLATALLARVLGRPAALTDPGAVLSPELRGALAALTLEVARRAGGRLELRAARGATPAAGGVRVEATVLLDERPHGLCAWAFDVAPPTRGEEAPQLAAAGALPISLPLVVAASVAAEEDVRRLAPGDAWMPAGGWLHRSTATQSDDVHARAALAAPAGEWGVEVRRSGGDRFVVRGIVVTLAADVHGPPPGGDAGTMSDSDSTLTAVALDAPVVVRVEVGSVTLTAREWAELRPGDVIETGVRLAEPVVLRIAGRELARGELVNVDGELGVRIRELVGTERTR